MGWTCARRYRKAPALPKLLAKKGLRPRSGGNPHINPTPVTSTGSDGVAARTRRCILCRPRREADRRLTLMVLAIATDAEQAAHRVSGEHSAGPRSVSLGAPFGCRPFPVFALLVGVVAALSANACGLWGQPQCDLPVAGARLRAETAPRGAVFVNHSQSRCLV